METQETPFRAALRSGLIVGLVMLAITYLIYFIDSSLLASGWLGLVVLVLYFIIVLVMGINYRKENGGYLAFGAAFQFAFITLVVAGIIGILGNIILYTVIDPALPQVLADQQLESTVELMEKFGGGNALSSEQLEEMRKGFVDGYSVMGQLKGFGIMLILDAIIALILGAIIKKKDKSLSF